MPKRTARKSKAQRRRPTAPRSRGEPLPLSFINHLRRNVDGFKRLSGQVQHNLAYFAWMEGTWTRQHAYLDDHMTIHYRELERRFGRDGFKEVNDAVQMFKVTQQWWSGKGLTRGYQLTAHVAAVKAEYLHDRNIRLTHLIQNDGKRMRTIPDAIAGKDIEGRTQTVWRHKVVNRVPVDVLRLRLLYDRLRLLQRDLRAGRGTGDLYVSADAEQVDYQCDMLAQFLRFTHTTVAGKGYVPIRYIVGRTGRLYARGTSLQNMPRGIRKVALHGLWDYDIENCHYAIFQQMAGQFGFDAQAITAYLAHKRATREGIADRTGISVEQVKQALLATMYGARASSWDASAIPEMLGGSAAAARLYADPEFAAIRRDIQDGRQVILSRHVKRRTTMLNAVGQPIKLREPPEDRLAHLIQGIEAQALRAVQAAHRDDIVLLMHDGWVSQVRLDRAQLVELIREATGYDLKLSETRITLPANLDLTNLQN